MNDYMEWAVQLVADNVREGGEPFGAVLVKDGKTVAKVSNELHQQYDVSGHAELVAIRKAQEEMQTHDLSEFTLYASGESCPMCLTAMYNSNIMDTHYCASIEETAEMGLGASVGIYDELKKPNEDRKLAMKHMALEARQENPMQMWKERN